MPVFVDVLEGTFNLDPASLERGIRTAKAEGLRPRAAIAVDLFGQPADYHAIEAICARHGLWLMADAAQSFGATYRGRQVGQLAPLTATSFFPAKPLGCYGDGGCVFTDDDDLAEAMRSLRVHGQGAGQVRQRPGRRERPARHPAGRDSAREAHDLRGRAVGPAGGGGALR